jgi:hypothetical protein
VRERTRTAAAAAAAAEAEGVAGGGGGGGSIAGGEAEVAHSRFAPTDLAGCLSLSLSPSSRLFFFF